ncbi:MFS transporter [Actinospica durhamensis]|uniref:MFS transporter n=1 Tax=Actinospica durhamensis TaxID=1508375 RepID=A0A941ISZ0_9ACTN|nr:MFS transporter [Actinospica durhamensis]MBR7833771.1 MFS transporter [Actinospica durhamensis]
MSAVSIAPERQSESAPISARHIVVLIALVWNVALNPIAGLLLGNAQASVAIHFRTTQIAWFTLGPVLVGTFLTPFTMKCAAAYGKKRTMVVCTAVGLVGDVIAALATNYSVMLAGRFLTGVYVTSALVSYAMARDAFPQRMVKTASGLLAGSIGLVGVAGPFLSAWLIDSWSFRGALWFLVISTGACLLLQVFGLTESPVRERDARMDWLGGILLGGGLTALVYAIGEGSSWGWSSGKLLAYVGAGLVAVIVFVFVESRIAHPLVPLALIRRRRVWTVLVATGLAAGAAYAVGTVVQLLTLMPKIPMVSDGLGWSVSRSALAGAPTSALVIVVAVFAGKLARRFDSRLMLALGTVLMAVGYAIGSHWHYTVAEFIVMGLVSGPGMGLVLSVMPIMIVESVAPQEQALANGTEWLIQGVAQTLASQLIFVVMAHGGTVLQGTQFYHDSGFTHGYYLVIGCMVLGALLTLIIPKARAADQLEASSAV